jgi:hypothetical protein
MRVLKLALSAAMLTTMLFTGGTSDVSWAEAQASTPITDSAPARDVATSHEDIALTNSCIENGKEKVYCLCITKIFKHEMSLRQYRGAISLYGQDDSSDAQNHLTKQGYSKNESGLIKALSSDLTSEDLFRTRCDKAENYFAAASDG